MTNAQPPPVGSGGATNEHRVNGKVWVAPQMPASTPARSRARISRAIVNGATLALVAAFAWAVMSRPAPPAADSGAGAPTSTGFAARVFEIMPRGRYSQACQVSVHTRGFSDLAVLAWREVKTGGARHDTTTGARCAVAHRASELVVRGMVPAAGGTPWSMTPQTPSPAALAAQPPCELLTQVVDDYLPGDLVIRPVHDSTARGPQCSIATRRSRVVGLFTRRLADLPVGEGMALSPLPMGLLTARTEHLKDGCAAAVEVAPGRTIRIQYEHRDAGSRACDVARMFLVRMIQELLYHTT